MTRLPSVPIVWGVAATALAIAACREAAPVNRVRVSGQVEATEVHVAPLVGGTILELRVAEGDRVAAGDIVARLDTRDAELALARGRAERDQADAQLRLLRAGSRAEDVRQAQAQLEMAESEAAAADAELAAAETDLARFESLLAANSGSRKQRDDAAARRDVARERSRAARDRVRAARENVGRLRAGARREEIEAAQARVAAADAQIAVWEKAIGDAIVKSPVAGVITEKLADAGEVVQPRTPLVIVTDLDRAWANVYVDEPAVPRLRLGQKVTLYTDAGGDGLEGTISTVASRAEFTPRNVQTAEDRSKLVYRVKVAVDNRAGILKVGMPVEADIPLEPQ